MAERVSATRLGAELPRRAEFGDVEINLQDALLRQEPIDPQRQRKLK
jgi:hypothetical protein